MTEQSLRARVCSQARAWVGKCEADNSYWPIIEIYNSITPLPRGYKMKPKDPWCAAFVAAVAQVLGLCAWIFPECGCRQMVSLYQTAGRWMEDDAYLPEPGDVIFYDWEDDGAGDNAGTPDHVGLVAEVDGDTITVIEGNWGRAVAAHTIRRDGQFIRGYGLPDYAAAAEALSEEIPPADELPEGEILDDAETPAAVTLPAPPDGWAYVPLPILQIGDGGAGSPMEEAVRAAQYLLRDRGFSVGFWGCDGEFGRQTESAVGRFQADRQIEHDGVVGPETWRKLICD